MTFMSGGGGGGGAGGSLPTGVNQSWLESQGGTTNVWQPAPYELLTSVLTNATSTGDAGSRADHFLGSSLSGNWTTNQGSGTPTVLVGNSTVSATLGANVGYILQPYTPTAAWAVVARMKLFVGSTSADFGLVVRDSTAGADTGGQMWCIMAYTNTTTFQVTFYTVAAGSATSRFTFLGIATNEWLNATDFFIRLRQDVSGNSFAAISRDRVTWQESSAVASGVFSFTPAKMGFRMTGAANTPIYSADFIDVVT